MAKTLSSDLIRAGSAAIERWQTTTRGGDSRRGPVRLYTQSRRQQRVIGGGYNGNRRAVSRRRELTSWRYSEQAASRHSEHHVIRYAAGFATQRSRLRRSARRQYVIAAMRFIVTYGNARKERRCSALVEVMFARLSASDAGREERHESGNSHAREVCFDGTLREEFRTFTLRSSLFTRHMARCNAQARCRYVRRCGGAR